ncbi:MAG TPA: hypothetical protein VKA89_03755 [Solirubrobacterales bacterium]|nr:hypothetical protein [Solirubrobacterales bacterium]
MAEVLEERWRLEDGYRIELFEEQDAVGVADVIELWEREGVVPRFEGERRVHEILLVGIHEADALAGVSTAYLRRNEQLRMDLWHYRAFVPDAHRMSNVAVNLAVRGRQLLEDRFVEGRDARAGGLLFVVENDGLKRAFNEALWSPSDVTFVGEDARGAHVRVRYFEGALAPEPET